MSEWIEMNQFLIRCFSRDLHQSVVRLCQVKEQLFFRIPYSWDIFFTHILILDIRFVDCDTCMNTAANLYKLISLWDYLLMSLFSNNCFEVHQGVK